MPIETGDYQELHAFEKSIDFGLYRGMPNCAKWVLLLQIRHANWPTGWVWVGKQRAQKTLGINTDRWLKALYFLGNNLFYNAWAWQATEGRPALAVKLDLQVPSGRVPIPEKPPLKLYDHSGPKVGGLTIGLIEAHFRTIIGQPYDRIVLNPPITLKNPKEPFKRVEDKSSSEKQEPEALINEAIESISVIATADRVKAVLKKVPKKYHHRIVAYLIARWGHDRDGLAKLLKAKAEYYLKHGLKEGKRAKGE